jgi:uracil-DNA glycosylase
MSELHPVEYLFKRMDELVTDYPEGKVIRISERIGGNAFFPGGYGLWGTQPGKPLPPMPVGGVMMLGHNFDCEKGFKESLRNQGENPTGSTWCNLLKLLKVVDIPKERCFFTNFYMGLKPGDKATGKLPAAADIPFVRCCQDFFREQLRVMQPKIVLVLGKEFFSEFATFLPLESQVKSAWMRAKTWQYLDQCNAAFIYPLRFPEVSHPTVVVALVHPSYRSLNVGMRRYKNFVGEAAELAMLQAALTMVGTI